MLFICFFSFVLLLLEMRCYPGFCSEYKSQYGHPWKPLATLCNFCYPECTVVAYRDALGPVSQNKQTNDQKKKIFVHLIKPYDIWDLPTEIFMDWIFESSLSLYNLCVRQTPWKEEIMFGALKGVNERKEQAQGSSEQIKCISVRVFISIEFLWETSDSYCNGADILSGVFINKSYKLPDSSKYSVLLKSMGTC